jgi:hypothetical protein
VDVGYTGVEVGYTGVEEAGYDETGYVGVLTG